MYYHSKYTVTFEDDGNIIAVNLLSTALLRLEKEKFIAIQEDRAETAFTQEEIKALLRMGYINEDNDEFNFLWNRRLQNYEKQTNNIYTIEMLPTTKCNARCYYCYESCIEKYDMSFETADKIVEYIKRNRGDRKVSLKWFGGEPLFKKEIIDYICGKIKDAGIDYYSSMITNAYLINDYIEEAESLWNLRFLQITIDAIEKEYNKIKNYIYKEEDAFERVMNNVGLLLDKDITVILRINFDPRDVKKAIHTIEYLHKRFGNHKYLKVYCALIVAEGVPTPFDFPPEENPFLEIFSHLLKYDYINDLSEMNIRPKLLNCSVHNNEMMIVDPNGGLHKCQHAIINGEQDAFGDVVNGITDQEKKAVWEELKHPYDECKECVCLPLCQGGCRYRVLHDKQENVCLPIKNCIKEAVKLFYNKKIKGEKP